MNNNHAIVRIGDSFPYSTSFSRLWLSMSVGEHHQCIVECKANFKNPNFDANQWREWLGSPCSVEVGQVHLSAYYNGAALTPVFNGYVTDIDFKNAQKDHIKFVIKALSPTISMDAHKMYRSWSGKTLKQIVEDVVRPYAALFKKSAIVQPTYIQPIEYMVQWQTDWEFLKYLANEYNEWLFDTGFNLQFGKNTDNQSVTLDFASEIAHVSQILKAKPTKFSVAGYDYVTNRFGKVASKAELIGQNPLIQQVIQGAKTLFPNGTTTLIEQNMTESELTVAAQSIVKQQVTKLVLLKGSTFVAKPRLGKSIEIDSQDYDYGKYRITKIIHEISMDKVYYCHFEAIPSEMIAPFLDRVKRAYCQTAVGEIVAYDDKIGGRVRVRMAFQTRTPVNDLPWVRVLSAFGGGDANESHWMAEIGAKVLLGFERNNPAKPFIIGSFHNGNSIKNFATRHGDKHGFQTKENAVFISEKPNNACIQVKSSHKISCEATQLLELLSDRVHISAEGKIVINAETIELNGGQIKLSGNNGESFIFKNGNITMETAKQIVISSSKTKLH
jgi:type VI secretion system secreted protein VgrG